METNTIIKRAKILNYVEIVITIALYALMKILNSASKNVTT